MHDPITDRLIYVAKGMPRVHRGEPIDLGNLLFHQGYVVNFEDGQLVDMGASISENVPVRVSVYIPTQQRTIYFRNGKVVKDAIKAK